MEKLLDNKRAKVIDTLQEEIKENSKISVISAYFTIYAYDKLKGSLQNVEELRFLFVEPTFTQQKDDRREFYIEQRDREKQLSGTEFEIKLRNELTQSKVAKECADWIKEKTEFRSLKKSDTSTARIVHCSSDDEKDFVVQGALDFTSAGLGATNSRKLDLNMYTDDSSATQEVLNWFDQIWDNPDLVEDVKEEVLENIQTIYNENSPEFIYFVTLYNIFKDFIDDLEEDDIIKPKTGFMETLVWNKLYKFQKDGVMGAISKLDEHNGCILADSVGLGKTFEGLAVIKYYELRNDRVLVLCPKKLRDNWTMYRVNDKRNILADDRFNYDVLNHTDLSREKGSSGDINLETVNWGNYDLVVIDESHNFRNNDLRKNKKTRYRKLMEDIMQSGVKTKVLMLSATPVNNKLNDLKNQIAFITEGNDNALVTSGIDSIQSTLRVAQQVFNVWQKSSQKERTLENLLKQLNVDYFKLLDSLTIARSRKHIQKYYDLSEVGKFPERLKPVNYKTQVDTKNEFPDLGDVNDDIRHLQLAMYSPLRYVFPDKRQKYEELYDIKLSSGSEFKQSDRENNIIHLMRVNILKRLESSVYSYTLTLSKMLKKTSAVLSQIEEFEKNNSVSVGNIFTSVEGDQEESIDGDDPELEGLLVGNKVRVSLEDIDIIKWKEDLYDDRSKFQNLVNDARKITPERDEKLRQMKEVIDDKIRAPFNAGNKKLLIFSTYADTTKYLFDQISTWVKEEFDVNVALVTGTGSNKVTTNRINKEFNSILTHFSPISKEKEKIYPESQETIDIIIATDCISEGQNLQDCDCLVNYDIHWNPVKIIQRFGRIDRIGSTNDSVKLINFWPNMELDAYINLEQRVRGRMVLLNVNAAGEEDIINETDTQVMNDIEYRKNQLLKLQEEVLDLEDISGNISITDLTMNDFKMDLVEYMKEHKDKLEKAPLGMYAIADSTIVKDDSVQKGVLFVLKQVNFSELTSKESNAIHPYYLLYITNEGEIIYGYMQAKYILDLLKKVSNGVTDIATELVSEFDQETDEARNMKKYSTLLARAVEEIIGQRQEMGVEAVFQLGRNNIAEDSALSGLDDFELISFMIIK